MSDEIPFSQLAETINAAIVSANTDYEKMSGGNWICDNGVENFMQTRVADAIWKDFCRLGQRLAYMEISIKDVKKFANAKPSLGRPPGIIAGSQRFDIVLAKSDGEHSVMPTHLIELKRGPWHGPASDDISKLYSAVRANGRANGGSIEFGIFSCFNYAIEGSETLAKKALELKRQELKSFLADHYGSTYRAYISDDKNWRTETGKPKLVEGKWWVPGAFSLCIYAEAERWGK